MNRRGFIGALTASFAMFRQREYPRKTSVPAGAFRVDFFHKGSAHESLEDAELWLRAAYPKREFYSIGNQFVYQMTDHDISIPGRMSCAFVLSETWRQERKEWAASRPPLKVTVSGKFGIGPFLSIDSPEYMAMIPPENKLPQRAFLVIDLGINEGRS